MKLRCMCGREFRSLWRLHRHWKITERRRKLHRYVVRSGRGGHTHKPVTLRFPFGVKP